MPDELRSTETHELFDRTSTVGRSADTGPGDAAEGVRERLANDLAFVGVKPGALAGTKVGSVRIDDLLGAGGMGEVYRGFDEKLERPVAIKTILAKHRLDEHAKARFLREARVLSKLHHPGICQVFDLLQAESADLLVIELIEGRTLRECASGLKTEEKLLIGRQIAEGLAAAHRRGIVHRDLKPENVMVTQEGGAKILDFGIARSYSTQDLQPADAAGSAVAEATAESDPEDARDKTDAFALTALGMVVGTLSYMSPEQARGEGAGPASDIYSLGILLQELFTGRPAYADASLGEMLRMVADGETLPPQGIDQDMARLITKMKSPEIVWRPDAQSVADTLKWIQEKPARRARRRWTGVGVFIGLIVVAMSFWVSRNLALGGRLLASDQRGRVVVLPIENRTGDEAMSWVEEGLADMVSSTLSKIEGIDVIEQERVKKELQGMGFAESKARSAPEAAPGLAADLSNSFGADIVVFSTIEGKPGEYTVTYTTWNRAGRSSTRRVEGMDPSEVAAELSRRISLRLRPEADPVSFGETYSSDPVLNRLYAIGVDRITRKGPASARPYFDVCVDNDSSFAWARLRLAQCDQKAGDLSAARSRGESFLQDPVFADDPALLESARTLLGMVARSQGEYQQSESHFRAALESAKQRGNIAQQAKYASSLSLVLLDTGRLDEAEEICRGSLEVAKELGDLPQQATAQNNLGLIRWKRMDLPGAKTAYEETLEISRRSKNRESEAVALNNLGLISQERKELDDAETYISEALEIAKAMGSRELMAERLGNLGLIASAKHDYPKAESMLSGAIAVLQEIGNSRAAAHFHGLLAEVYLKEGKLPEARKSLDQFRPWFKQDEFFIPLIEARYQYELGSFAAAARLAAEAKKAAGQRWGETEQALLVAYQQSAREGRKVPLPD